MGIRLNLISDNDPLTVGELKKRLAAHKDSTPVYLTDGNDEAHALRDVERMEVHRIGKEGKPSSVSAAVLLPKQIEFRVNEHDPVQKAVESVETKMAAQREGA